MRSWGGYWVSISCVLNNVIQKTRVEIFTCLGSSHDFLTTIFGILRIFVVGIGKQYFQKIFFQDQKFFAKKFFSKHVQIFFQNKNWNFEKSKSWKFEKLKFSNFQLFEFLIFQNFNFCFEKNLEIFFEFFLHELFLILKNIFWKYFLPVPTKKILRIPKIVVRKSCDEPKHVKTSTLVC